MKKKTWLSTTVLTLALSVLITACGGAATQTPTAAPAAPASGEAAPANGEAAPTTGEAAPASEGPVTIRVFSPQNTTSDLATNSFSLEAEKQFNIKFEWQTTTFDATSAKEQRQISLASGDYPDLYLLIPWVDQFSQAELLRYGQQGVILPLNDLLKEHAPNVMAAMEENTYFKAIATAPDGNIYGIPQINECFHCSYPNKMWMNSAWLEKLGLETPTTTEEFKAVLEAFRDNDPNGNGVADEVPLSGSTEEYGVRVIPFLMNGFVYNDDRTYLMVNDGKVETAATTNEWKEGLAYIKSLVDEGLIDPGAFTQNAEALKMIGDNASAELLGASAGMHPAIFVTTGSDSPYGSHYDAIPPLKGPYSNYASYNYPVTPGATFVLTNKASPEVQVAAVKLLDSMFTQEGQLRAHFGEEGVDWRRPAEGDVALGEGVEPLMATIPLPPEDPGNRAWGAMAQYYQPRAFRDSWIQATDIYAAEGYERRLQEATTLYEGKEPATPFPHWAIWVDPAEADEFATLRTNITSYIDQNALQFVTGSLSLEDDWDNYVSGLEQLNFARYQEMMQKAYDASGIK